MQRLTLLAVLLTATPLFAQSLFAQSYTDRPPVNSEEYLNTPAPRYLPPEKMTADPADPMYGPWQNAADKLNDWANWYFKHGVNDLQRQKRARQAIIKLMTSPGWVWCEPMCDETKE